MPIALPASRIRSLTIPRIGRSAWPAVAALAAVALLVQAVTGSAGHIPAADLLRLIGVAAAFGIASHRLEGASARRVELLGLVLTLTMVGMTALNAALVAFAPSACYATVSASTFV
jgi:hypothetical protein